MPTDSVEVELHIGMRDFALAKLVSSEYHTIEFPTILLPKDAEAGSIIKLQCSRAVETEVRDKKQFETVQARIKELFTSNLPKNPVLRARNTTQTSIVLEWNPIDVASADLHYMALFKGDQRIGFIPRPQQRTATKVSNLEIDAPYKFRLVLSTSAGVFESNELHIRTHKMSNLTGIVACIGSLEYSAISEAEIRETLERLGCKEPQDTVKLDTTHFICSTEGGAAFEKAVELNIPVIRPEWLKACEKEHALASVRGFYLSVDPPKAATPATHVPSPESQPQKPSDLSTQAETLAESEHNEDNVTSEANIGEPGAIVEPHDEEISAELDRVGPIDPSSIKSVRSLDISEDPPTPSVVVGGEREIEREVTEDPNAQLRECEGQKVVVTDIPEPQSADVIPDSELKESTPEQHAQDTVDNNANDEQNTVDNVDMRDDASDINDAKDDSSAETESKKGVDVEKNSTEIVDSENTESLQLQTNADSGPVASEAPESIVNETSTANAANDDATLHSESPHNPENESWNSEPTENETMTNGSSGISDGTTNNTKKSKSNKNKKKNKRK